MVTDTVSMLFEYEPLYFIDTYVKKENILLIPFQCFNYIRMIKEGIYD